MTESRSPDSSQPLSDSQAKLMDSLLSRTLRADLSGDETRVRELLAVIRREAPSPQPAVAASRAPGPWRLLPWLPLPVGAALLVGMLLLLLPGESTSKAAIAALDRAIEAEQSAVAREYAVTIRIEGEAGERRTRTHRLFVRGSDFAIRTERWVGFSGTWAGGQGKERWIVPRFGPVLVGNQGLFHRKAARNPVVETPFLSLGRILERMRRLYKLSLNSSVELTQDGQSVTCRHLVGLREDPQRTAIPERVELWADVHTGFARRVQLEWTRGANGQWLEATAELVDTPVLADDFFSHSAHHASNRRVLHID